MGRLLLFAVLAYGYGDASFDGHRPGPLDTPLREFHRSVEVSAAQARQLLISFDDNARIVSELPKLAAKLRSLGSTLAVR